MNGAGQEALLMSGCQIPGVSSPSASLFRPSEYKALLTLLSLMALAKLPKRGGIYGGLPRRKFLSSLSSAGIKLGSSSRMGAAAVPNEYPG